MAVRGVRGAVPAAGRGAQARLFAASARCRHVARPRNSGDFAIHEVAPRRERRPGAHHPRRAAAATAESRQSRPAARKTSRHALRRPANPWQGSGLAPEGHVADEESANARRRRHGEHGDAAEASRRLARRRGARHLARLPERCDFLDGARQDRRRAEFLAGTVRPCRAGGPEPRSSGGRIRRRRLA